jgi:hypothetical protein
MFSILLEKSYYLHNPSYLLHKKETSKWNFSFSSLEERGQKREVVIISNMQYLQYIAIINDFSADFNNEKGMMKHSVLKQLQRDNNRMENCTDEMSGIGESKWCQIGNCHDGDLRSSSSFSPREIRRCQWQYLGN